METTSESDNELNVGYNFGNFNPDDVEVEDTINAVFAIDVSGSVGSYVDELNKGMNEFTERMQNSHVAEKLFVSIVEFETDVHVKTGFQPINQLAPVDFSNSIGGLTSLYEGTKVALKNALDYREGLENAGVNCKTLLFVITDGDNNQPGEASDVKDIITDLLSEERNFASFESILFGIGGQQGMEDTFRQAAEDMGIKNVATISDSAEDIKRMITFISSSVSSASGGGSAISTPNF